MVDFFQIQLVFHAKALEYYTKCFESVSMIDEERDIQVSLYLHQSILTLTRCSSAMQYCEKETNKLNEYALVLHTINPWKSIG